VLLLYTHASFHAHDTGDHHPERPQRVAAAVTGAKASGREITEMTPPPANRTELLRVHEAGYVDGIEAFCSSGGGALDADTYAVTESWEAAIRAAGAGTAAAAALEEGHGEEAFLAVRPPGHHATSTRAMGFCLFNNVAVTAASLTAAGSRVAIVDWDVHHGNGTQDTFFRDGSVLYVSIHEFPFYPGTGWVDELGAGPGSGTTINIPLPAGTAGDVYRAAMAEVAVPALETFGPDWLLVSAGYDAHAADPLADIRLEAADYAAMATALRATVPSGRTVYFLEGGYDLDAVEASVEATLSLAAPEQGSGTSPAGAWRALELAADQMRRN
jgi:acetoin utilization deacetylase AcuC-like enzyme